MKSTKGKIDETIGAEDTKCVDIPPFPTKPRHSVIDIENLNLSDEEECLPRYLAKNEPMSRVKSESGLIDFSDQDEIDLQQILLPPGSTSMSSAWKGKGFWFQSIPEISYGLQHSEKGPCGVVASVQAHIIKYLAYKVECLVNGKLWLKAGQTQSALCRAIKDILWNAKHQHCCLVL